MPVNSDLTEAQVREFGSGPGGQRAATQAAKLRKRVAMCEKQHDVGGVFLRQSRVGDGPRLAKHGTRAAQLFPHFLRRIGGKRSQQQDHCG